MQRSITIAGGGLAGLTLGLLLRRENIPVEIWEAGSYPRHRVCGEFISGHGLHILRELALPGIPDDLGVPATSARLFHREWRSPMFKLPERALSVCRAALDSALALQFRSLGGVLHENRRWTESCDREGFVRATGRRSACQGESCFVGFKLHAFEFELMADLEVHFSEDAYVGLSRQRGGVVNICGLFRKSANVDPGSIRNGEVFRRVLSSPAKERLAAARFDPDSFSAVAGISLKRETTFSTKECRIGDTICMIPPLTGNGMSLAIESAALAAPFLSQYSSGTLSWDQARAGISQTCDKQFRRRLFSAALLQKGVSAGPGRDLLMYLLQTSFRFFDLWFRLTR